MTALPFDANPADIGRVFYDLGNAYLAKQAEAPVATYSLSGRLYLSGSGWLLLQVPNAFVRGLFSALNEPGAELPEDLDAHISVMTRDEVEAIGGDNIVDRGRSFSYNLGPIKSVAPHGQSDRFSRVWFVTVQSPDLKQLRRSYGLTSLPYGDHEFHITVAYRRKHVLSSNEVSKAAELVGECEFAYEKAGSYAEGIPSRHNYGALESVPENQLMTFLIQRHLAERAGPHYDMRMGNPDLGLFSWATRKELPTPGQKTLWVRQPLHSYGYKDFEGRIPQGYGAGEVKKQREGQLIVTKRSPDFIHFTLADKKHPERFVLMRPKGWERDTDWLLINTTPTAPVPYQKVRYQRMPAEAVDAYLNKMESGDSVEAKLDGASSLIRLLKDGVELVSYRQSKETGRPILHTERVLRGNPQLKIPPELVGSVLKGELYGVRKDDSSVIPPQELGGILNAGVAESWRKQDAQGVKLRNMLYDIQQLGNNQIDWHSVPRPERRKMMEQVLQHLPQDTFHLSEAAADPESAKQLWQKIRGGEHPLTNEGMIIWPSHGKPSKAKLTEDSDVFVRGIFPGEGKYKDVAAGGFEYSLDPEGPVVGRVGTGFSDEVRRSMSSRPDDFVGRRARIKSQQQLPSGAYRAPSFIALHEDYDGVKQASEGVDVGFTFSELAELGIVKNAERFFLQEAFKTQPVDWDVAKSPIDNVGQYLAGVNNNVQQRMRKAYGSDEFMRGLDPHGYGMERLSAELQHGDTVVTDPHDRAVQLMSQLLPQQ